MCLLVYPKSEKQISVLTSLLEEMGIYFEKSEDISYEIPEEHKIDSFTLDEEDLKKIAKSNEEAEQGLLIPSEEVRKKALELCTK